MLVVICCANGSCVQALIHMEEDPNTGFRKLTFLLQNPPFPPETFCA